MGLALGIGAWCLVMVSCAPLISGGSQAVSVEPSVDPISNTLTASISDIPQISPEDRIAFAARRQGAVSGFQEDLPSDTLAVPISLGDETGPRRTEFILENEQENIQTFLDLKGITVGSVRQTGIVPAVFFQALPWNLEPMTDIQARKDIYLAILLPLVLDVNREIEAERALLLNSAFRGSINQVTDPAIRELAAKYYELDGSVQSLLNKVAPLPVDMVLAQSIEESGWGTSRFVLKGHALFGQRVFSDEAHGFIPRQREEGLEFKVQGFDSLKDSIAIYALNLNRHRSYETMRQTRAALMASSKPVTGKDLMPHLQAYSTERSKYINKVKRLIDHNKLSDFNTAKLETHRALDVIFTQSYFDKLDELAQAQ